jgi:hypothetical protein
MARFIIGDTLGSIKSLAFSPAPSSSDEPVSFEAKTLLEGTSLGKGKAVQALDCDGPNLVNHFLLSLCDVAAVEWYLGKITAVRADGTAAIYTPEEEGGLAVVHEWKEARFRKDSVFVGLSCTDGLVGSHMAQR